MLDHRPVRIPAIPGKIFQVRIDGHTYIRYLAGRQYRKDRKYNVPEFRVIGVRIENMPSLMIPNENYRYYFTREGNEMDEESKTEEEKAAREAAYMDARTTYRRYREFFNDLYAEMRVQSRKDLNARITPYQAESLNRVLAPLREMMKDEEYAGLLQEVQVPGEGEEGTTFGDVMVLLTQYQSALGRYRNERL